MHNTSLLAALENLQARQLTSIFGLPFDVVSERQAIDHLISCIESNKRCFLSTPNLNFAIASQNNRSFRQSVLESDLSVADGMPLIWISKLAGPCLPERVAGSSVFQELYKTPANSKIKVFYFGGNPGVAELAHQETNRVSPGMESVGFYDPGFGSIDDMSSADIIEKINTAKPDFLLIALGAVKGQAWIQHNQHRLDASVISHLGAVINFVAGSVSRAPKFWQRIGAEWLWRIIEEPSLWKRYFSDGKMFTQLFFTRVIPLYLRQLRENNQTEDSTATLLIRADSLDQPISVLFNGTFSARDCDTLLAQLKEILQAEQDSKQMSLDITSATDIKAPAIAKLAILQALLNNHGIEFSLTGAQQNIVKLLKLHMVEGLISR
ncbi:WecB/TagA/CpsF family glycosyltransferase [Teredinibacter waterburyi]|uniref:WecB/TagA/CpsF family glycosyltransferase n=1 Tax=Teredinibacter waterburyi TaxID=1500538 RepID=UPI00165F01F7|nr:WecB/TagA/CpsF family glycosyltransferase [Teredinibacter waterburyi]